LGEEIFFSITVLLEGCKEKLRISKLFLTAKAAKNAKKNIKMRIVLNWYKNLIPLRPKGHEGLLKKKALPENGRAFK
jgi:hypothetical protein